MGNLHKAILLFSCLCLTNCQKMGPFKVLVKKLENCTPLDGKAWVWDPKIKKYNRTMFAVDTDVVITQQFDDSIDVKVAMAQFTNNGWKDNFFNQVWKTGCSVVKSYATDLFENIAHNIGVKPNCPIKKGNYTVRNAPLSIHINNVPAFFYNTYRFNFKLLDKGRAIFCFDAIVDVVPKNHKQG